MFKSIRWRFILIYFLLVFLAMSIVGMFIMTKLTQIQVEMSSKNMEARIKSILASSTALQEDNWEQFTEEIKSSIKNGIQIGYDENIYIILNDDKKTVIAASIEGTEGESAYNINKINSYILTKSTEGSPESLVPKELYDNSSAVNNHMSFPVYEDMTSGGKIKGFIYLTNNIEYIYETIDESKEIITQATVIALLLTVLLGLVLARSITGPIMDLTVKAKLMSHGDFDQKVEVKSSDEIGQLGNMFNFLTGELKKTLSNLQQEKSKMETTFKYMADGVLTIDTYGNIIHANPVARQIIALNNDEENYDVIISSLNQSMSLMNLKNKNYHGSAILEQGGQTYKVDYGPFMNNENEIGGVILVFKNVTEQFKLEKMQKEFVANVSHELKTPITTIKSYTETLLDGALSEKTIAEDFLNVINSESDRMSRLVSDLLKLSKMDFEKSKWKEEKLSVKSMLTDAYKKFSIHAKNKGIELHLGDISENMNIMFDRDGFEQIIINIAGNAIKYTPEGGNVWVNAVRENGKIAVSIKDDGIGIPKEDLGRVFDRFYRVDKARTREMGGTGLGLSIAKQIADEYNSILTIESEVQKGTEIKIIIPEYEEAKLDKS